MDNLKILSGDELVARGTTKTDGSLPEIGVKDVFPNGSWLEQKQIQSALEARKHLIEVERIEKSSVLSHAEWREDLKLAEVTQKMGGYWQYVGHNVGKQLFLRPEEALSLMEANCLHLKHNEVTVSLQKAHSLLLGGDIFLYQYKVYAHLSRLGYKVFRHKDSHGTDHGKKINLIPQKMEADTEYMEEQVDAEEKLEGNGKEDFKMEVENCGRTEHSDNTCENTGRNSLRQQVLEAGSNTEIKPESMETENIQITPKVDDGNNTNPSESLVVNEFSNNHRELDSNNLIEKCGENTKTQSSDLIVTNNSVEASASIESTNSNKHSTNSWSDYQCDTEHENRNVMKIYSETGNTICESSGASQSARAGDPQSTKSNKQIDECVSSCPRDSNLGEGNALEIDSKTRDTINKSSDQRVSEKPSETYNKQSPNQISGCEPSSEPDKNNVIEIHSKTEKLMRNSINKSSNKTAIADDSTNSVQLDEHIIINEAEKSKVIEIDSDSENVINNTGSSKSNVCNQVNETYNVGSTNSRTEIDDCVLINQHTKLQTLESRKIRPTDSKNLHKCFDNIPEIFQKHVVTLKIPEEKYIPRNVFLNNTTYVLNIENIKTQSKDLRPASTESRPYRADEVNGAHILRVRDSLEGRSNNNWASPFPFNPQIRPFNFWRPRHNMNFIHFNLLFQRPFMPPFNINFMPRLATLPLRPQIFQQNPNLRNFTPNNNSSNRESMCSNPRKRLRNRNKQIHLEAIKRLAVRLNEMVRSGNSQTQNVQSLHRLIQTFNIRYRTSLRLTDQFEIVNDEAIVETIELDCEEASRNKRRRTETTDDTYKDNLNSLKQMALKLKGLESKNNATARHRRAFSSLVKRFNKSYKADVFMNNNYELLDRKYITLDSSSDSDCVIKDVQAPVASGGKMLRNPFNIIKRLTEKDKSKVVRLTTSKEGNHSDETTRQDNKYKEFLLQTFDKEWLPNENDFGRAEVIPRSLIYLMDTKREEYLFEFIKSQDYNFDNWLDIKMTFFKSIAQSAEEYENGMIMEEDTCRLTPIIGPGDCTDMPSVLKKLSIVKANKEVATETSLCIDFDVYNRDVQNFRKTDRPVPHFRVLCINESTSFPSGEEIAALHSKCGDVVIVLAIVGIGSISYLQIKPTDLPVYISKTDIDFS